MPQPPFVVVGASTGLGRATALRLLRDNHRVLVAGRDLARTQAAVPAATALRVDLTDLADVLNNFGQSNPNPTIPTPEPTSLIILAAASLHLATTRRHKLSANHFKPRHP